MKIKIRKRIKSTIKSKSRIYFCGFAFSCSRVSNSSYSILLLLLILLLILFLILIFLLILLLLTT